MITSVGFGRVDITPPPVGTGLGGFGPFLRRRSTAVRSAIYARAVAVSDGRSRWLIVSCELVGLGGRLVEQTVQLVTESTGWSPSEIAVHATHSHSGPATVLEFTGWGEPDPLYLLRLPHYIAAACLQAIEDLAPATIHHAEVPADGFSHNRMLPSPGRSNQAALQWAWSTDRPELVDTTAHMFRVDDHASGRMKGFFCYFSCHPVVCCESTTAIHGDFPGEALKEIESTDPTVIGVFLQGALGDINPNYAHGPEEESYEALTLFGHRFADCVRRGLDEALPVSDMRLGSSKSEIDYECGPYSLDELIKQRDEWTLKAIGGDLASPTNDAALAGVRAIGLDRIIRTLESGKDARRPLFVQSLALGPFVFTGLGTQPFHGIKRRHQQEFGPHHLLLSCTNGHVGYGPTKDAFHDGMDSYPAYLVPTFMAQLPFRADIEDTILTAVRRSVLEATRRA